MKTPKSQGKITRTINYHEILITSFSGLKSNAVPKTSTCVTKDIHVANK